MRTLGVRFDTPPLGKGAPPTGRCLILVTPDAQRTMNTCPGASHELNADALDEALIRSAAILYLEGYLFGSDLPRAIMARAVDIARDAGRQVAFTLSESVCIAGRKESFLRMIDNGAIDLLFANEDELFQLTQRSDLAGALADMAGKVPTLVITRGPAGAIAVERGTRVDIPAAPLTKLVDTTGAGDLFAAGFLTARVKGADLQRQLATGAIASAEVISHFGARPEADLKALVAL
jgi:sugar/nucleoside kinase (ribokinase family)